MNARFLNLYSIPTEWQILLDKIAEQDGEVSDDIIMEIYSLINHGRAKIEDAVLAKRNLEVLAEQAMAQARLFQKEYERCKAISDTWENAASKIGAAMVPVLKIVGKVQTVAGTAYLRKNESYSFALKEGAHFFELPENLWRQRDPELNKSVLRELAKADSLPEQIEASKTETISVCLKRPAARNTETIEQQEGAAA
jgi:hypothetical protein